MNEAEFMKQRVLPAAWCCMHLELVIGMTWDHTRILAANRCPCAAGCCLHLTADLAADSFLPGSVIMIQDTTGLTGALTILVQRAAQDCTAAGIC